MKKRKYTLKKRAEGQLDTRERIVDAAVQLHAELGPARTTIKALAERAGVQRLTVYRHFPDEQSLLAACSSKWMRGHPPPDPAGFGNDGPAQHTRSFVLALYRYYRDTQDMWTSVYRDATEVPAVADAVAGFEDYLESSKKALLAAWSPRRSKRLTATLEHALRFSTWQSLEARGDVAAADLVGVWTKAAAGMT
jgi:Bacterial regulatory proteins, tetR family